MDLDDRYRLSAAKINREYDMELFTVIQTLLGGTG